MNGALGLSTMSLVDDTDVNFTVQTLLLAAGWSLQECQSYAREHSAKQKKLTEFESSWTVSDSIIDLELVVLALNQLDENIYQNVPNWQKNLVDFFVNQRRSLTMQEQQSKRRAVYRKCRKQYQQPEDKAWLDQIRSQWKIIRNQLQKFEAFKVSMDWILQPSTYNYTIENLFNELGCTPTAIVEMENPSMHCDHVVELQLVVAAINRLWEGTYDGISDWEKLLVGFFDIPENKQVLTEEENEQKHLAVSRAIHCSSLLPGEKAWIAHVRSKWIVLKRDLSDFVAFKVQMDSILQVADTNK